MLQGWLNEIDKYELQHKNNRHCAVYYQGISPQKKIKSPYETVNQTGRQRKQYRNGCETNQLLFKQKEEWSIDIEEKRANE